VGALRGSLREDGDVLRVVRRAGCEHVQKSSWLALIRAMQKNGHDARENPARELGTPRHPRRAVALGRARVLPRPDSQRGSPKGRRLPRPDPQAVLPLERPVIECLLARSRPLGLRSSLKDEGEGAVGGSGGNGGGGDAHQTQARKAWPVSGAEETDERPAHAAPISPAGTASPGRTTVRTVPRQPKTDVRQPPNRHDHDGSSSKIVADQLRITSTSAHALALIEELHASSPLAMNGTVPARRIDVAAIPSISLHLAHQKQVREAWRASAQQAGSPLAQALSDAACDHTYTKYLKSNALMQPDGSGYRYSHLEQLYGTPATGQLATGVAHMYFTPGSEGASAALDSAIASLPSIDDEGELNDLTASVGDLSQAVGEALAEGVDVDNTWVCKAIYAALAGASGCAFKATATGSRKVLDWREVVNETLAAAASQGSGKSHRKRHGRGARYGQYKHAKTIGELKRLNPKKWRDDFRWDLAKAINCLTSVAGAAEAALNLRAAPTPNIAYFTRKALLMPKVLALREPPPSSELHYESSLATAAAAAGESFRRWADSHMRASLARVAASCPRGRGAASAAAVAAEPSANAPQRSARK